MDKYIINGGNILKGDVKISGAKNAALGILAGAILCEEDVIIENIPDVNDINIMIKAIESLGTIVKRIDRNTILINGSTINKTELIDKELCEMRATYYFVGALLSRFHTAKVILPGGCHIGNRPIDFHLKGFKALNAEALVVDGYIVANATNLYGNIISLDFASVGATINIMLASILGNGTTIIENAAKEPHVVDIANFLNSMGANVKGAGTDTIRIKGVKKLHGTTYTIIPDQIEAGTYMALSSITNGEITITNIIPKHLESIIAKIQSLGSQVIIYDAAVRVIGNGNINPINITTSPYPGFPTDMQPQISTVLSIANGISYVEESIFEDRFKYIFELKKMGANIELIDNAIEITGVKNLKHASLNASDLRAGAALVLAALSAEGISEVNNVSYIERGYEDFVNKLSDLGADIKRVTV